MISKFHHGLVCCNQKGHELLIKEGIFDMRAYHKHLFHILHVNNECLSNEHVISQFSDVYVQNETTTLDTDATRSSIDSQSRSRVVDANDQQIYSWIMS